MAELFVVTYYMQPLWLALDSKVLVQHLVFVSYSLWTSALLVPTFNLIALEARVISVLNCLTKGVKVIQRGDESL